MPTEYYPLHALNVPPDICLPATTQAIINLVSQYVVGQFPVGFTQIVKSETTPIPADQDKIWLKVDGAGLPIGFFLFVGGNWEPIAPSELYFAADTGSANSVAITVPNYPHTALDNGLFVVKMNAANTGGAATLTVNAFAAVPIKIGGVDPYANALLEDHYYEFVYTGTSFEILNPSDAQPTIGVRVVKSGLAVATQTVSLGPEITGIPAPVEVVFVNVTAEYGYNPGDMVNVDCVCTDYTGAAADGPYVMVTRGAGVVTLTLVASPTQINITNKITGASEQPFTPGNWTMTVFAFA